jgi:hypothetical protein
MNNQPSLLPIRTLLLAASLGLASCETPDSSKAQPAQSTQPTASTDSPSTARISQDLKATAAVVAVDKASRRVTLRNEAGRLVEIVAGEAVRNFDQIAVGDTLKIGYRASVTVSRLPASEAASAARGAVVAARAAKGEKPAGGAGVVVTARVRIESLDMASDIVVLSTFDGELIAHRIASEEGRAFAKGLKIGDVVQMDYEEAIALGIEKVPAGG